LSNTLEHQFWGSSGKRGGERKRGRSIEDNIRYCLVLLFCMAVFLWTGYRVSFFFPLGETEARPDNTGAEAPAQVGEDAREGKCTVLVIGSDKRANETARADIIMVVFLDTKEKTVRILNIPRDTYVNISAKKLNTKINHAYAYGGIAMAQETVENFLDIKIDHYVDTDFKGFASLVDALGGVDYNVEKRMYYPAENIDLQPGEQKLNGEQALGYVRFRSDGQGDIGRVERQQKFLPVLADHVLSLSTLWKIPKLIGIFQDNVKTDLTLGEMFSLANTYKSFDVSRMETRILPGEAEYINGVSYWVSYRDQVAKLVDEFTGKTPAVKEEQAGTPKESE